MNLSLQDTWIWEGYVFRPKQLSNITVTELLKLAAPHHETPFLFRPWLPPLMAGTYAHLIESFSSLLSHQATETGTEEIKTSLHMKARSWPHCFLMTHSYLSSFVLITTFQAMSLPWLMISAHIDIPCHYAEKHNVL